MKFANKLPKGKPAKALNLKYGGKNYKGYLVNIGGKYADALYYAIIPANYKKRAPNTPMTRYKYMLLGGFIRTAALKKLGIEVNAGGGIFKPRDYNKSLSKKTFLEIKKIQSEPVVKKTKYDIGMARKGNGTTVYNRAEEERGDYKNVAHISNNGIVKYYDKKLPSNIKKKIEAAAKKSFAEIKKIQKKY